MNILPKARQAARGLWREVQVYVIWLILPGLMAAGSYRLLGTIWAAVAGYLLWVGLFVAWRIWVMREFFMTHIRFIEVSLWGKTLDRENWGGKAPVRAGLLKEKPFAWKHKGVKEGGPT